MDHPRQDIVGQTFSAVAQAYDIPESELRSPTPRATVVEARRVVMQLLTERGIHQARISRMLHLHESTIRYHLALIRAQPTAEERLMLASLRRDAAVSPSSSRDASGSRPPKP